MLATLSLIAVTLMAPVGTPGSQAAAATSMAPAAASATANGVVKAADLSQFQPGNIISDAAFFHSGAMTETQIQQFLDSKLSRCAAGYTCLKDYYDTTRVTAADAMCGAYAGGARERASTIIYKVAQACGINPQVILVMLQKEQGLVLSSAPSTYNYRAAMGQGCPDTAACDARYYGFFNQVYGGAWQLKRYANPPGTSQYFTWYAPGKTWNVLYHPNRNCGSSPVLIQNQATANLYYYTPYQPNAAALRAGYGEGDGCSSYGNRNFYNYFNDWFGASSIAANSPFGNIEVIQATPGKFRVAGWAADPNTKDPIAVHVYVGSIGTAFTADLERSDVGAAYPTVGARHGFDVTVPANGAGDVAVCVYGINVGFGGHSLLACRTLSAMSGPPVGVIEGLSVADGKVSVSGWALDPDTTAAIPVHVYVDSTGDAFTANGNRSDIARVYPAYGGGHGYSATMAASPGAHTVCVYAINTGPGGHTVLGCQTVTVPGAADQGRPPMGNFEGLSISGATATASGWAIDPDTTGPIQVHLYVGSKGTAHTADKTREDVGRAHPAYGPHHGFVEQLTLPIGRSTVCAYAINNGAGGHTMLGCKTADVVTEKDMARPPVGNYEAAVPGAGGATISGWALDPDTSASIAVHIYVGSTGSAYVADKARPDVGRVYPLYGEKHGFAEFVPMPSGTHTVCAYGINTAAGGHTLLGCRDVTIP